MLPSEYEHFRKMNNPMAVLEQPEEHITIYRDDDSYVTISGINGKVEVQDSGMKIHRDVLCRMISFHGYLFVKWDGAYAFQKLLILLTGLEIRVISFCGSAVLKPGSGGLPWFRKTRFRRDSGVYRNAMRQLYFKSILGQLTPLCYIKDN